MFEDELDAEGLLARFLPLSRLPLGGEEGFVGAAAGVAFLRCSNSPQWEISTSLRGRSFLSTSTLARPFTMSKPETICPRTVCLALRCRQGPSVMKNL